MKLTKKITFSVSEKEMNFIDEQVKKMLDEFNINISVANFIRRCVRNYQDHLSCADMQGEMKKKYMSDDIDASNSFDEIKNKLNESYDIRTIVSNRKESHKKNDSHDYSPTNNHKSNKTLNVRFSEDERMFIEDRIKNINKKNNIHFSMGDFLRFCINTQQKIQQISKK